MSEGSILTKGSGGKRVIVIHELSPGDDHDGTGVIVEPFIGMHSTGHDT